MLQDTRWGVLLGKTKGAGGKSSRAYLVGLEQSLVLDVVLGQHGASVEV